MTRKVAVGFRDPRPRVLADWPAPARAVRCAACGFPSTVIPIVGNRAGVPGAFPVCDSCWFRVNPPDPGQLGETAA